MDATMTEALTAHITQVHNRGTVWSFEAQDKSGQTIIFHADWRMGMGLCESLLNQAYNEARDAGFVVPSSLPRIAIVSCLDVELIPSNDMGMDMPTVYPLELNVNRLQKVLADHKEADDADLPS